MVKANSQNKKLINVQPKKEDLQLSNIEPRSNKTESNTVISTRLDKPEPITLTNVEIKPDLTRKKLKLKRREAYSCLCAKLNEKLGSTSMIKTCINSLFATPAYIFSIIVLIGCIMLIMIIILTYFCIKVETTNKSYFAKCTSNSDCNNLLGLQCSAENGLCKCPAYQTKGRCDCSVGYFWNGTECARLMQYLETGCSGDYNCDKTKYLKCLNKVCTCETNKNWDSTTQTCRYNYLGCYEDSTYGTATHLFTQNSNRKMFYFVDMCITTCKNYYTNYSSIFVYGSNNYCYCLRSFPFNKPINCDTKCIGKNGEEYFCGGTATWAYRAVYFVNYS
jgi:hypothetical protein